MNTDLVCPTRIYADIEKRIAIHLSEDSVRSLRILASDRRIGCTELLPAPGIPLDSLLYNPFLGCEEALGYRIVMLLGSVGAELLLELPLALERAGYYHDTGGILIKAMDDSRPCIIIGCAEIIAITPYKRIGNGT